LTQVTVVPTATVNGFGANAVVVRLLAPRTIETVVPDPGAGLAGAVGVCDGLLGESPPHAANESAEQRMADERYNDAACFMQTGGAENTPVQSPS
jgi:hypothetical protein